MSPVFRHGRLRLYLLKLLDESPRHGYEVIRLLQDRFMGVYSPSPGTIYPRLARLEEEGLVTHDEAEGRKVYRITEKGREELRNRSEDLTELEDELTASVRDIAREVTEDVRETVRSLREELTWAARDMHGQTQPQARGGRNAATEQARDARDDVKERARATREQARQARTGAKEGARQARDSAKRGHGRHDATSEGERAEPGWGSWQDWQAWTDWPGRRGWPGPPGASGWANPSTYRDLERLARRFTSELRTAAWHAHAVSEDALGDLRAILDDTLDRIKSEVFGEGSAKVPHDDDPHDD
jgi:DNA-binding PadR family transcriptional regulator